MSLSPLYMMFVLASFLVSNFRGIFQGVIFRGQKSAFYHLAHPQIFMIAISQFL